MALVPPAEMPVTNILRLPPWLQNAFQFKVPPPKTKTQAEPDWLKAFLQNIGTKGVAPGTPTSGPLGVLSGGTSTPQTFPDAHGSLLLLLGEVIGVGVLAMLSDVDERVGRVIIAFLLVLWMVWLMVNYKTLQAWGAKFGV